MKQELATVNIQERIDSLRGELADLGKAVHGLSYRSSMGDLLQVKEQAMDFHLHIAELLALISDFFKTAEIRAGRQLIRTQIKSLWSDLDLYFGRKRFRRNTMFAMFYEGFNKVIKGETRVGLASLKAGIHSVERISQAMLRHAEDVVNTWRVLEPLDRTMAIIESVGLDRNWMIASVCVAIQEIAAKRKMKELGERYVEDRRRNVFKQLEDAYEKNMTDCPTTVSVVNHWTKTRAVLIHEGRKTSEDVATHIIRDTELLHKELFGSTN